MSNWHFLFFSLGMMLGASIGIWWQLMKIHDALKEIVMLQGRIQKPCLCDSIEALNVIARKLKELHGYG